MRVNLPSTGANVNQRNIIRNASRMPPVSRCGESPVSSSMLDVPGLTNPALRGIPRSNSDTRMSSDVEEATATTRYEEQFVISDPLGATTMDGRGPGAVGGGETDLNEVDWNQSQVIQPD